MIYNRRPQQVAAFTFDEAVQAGLQSGATMVCGMPSEFEFHGTRMRSECADTYVMSACDGLAYYFHRSDMLIAHEGTLTVVAAELFAEVYEPATPPIPEADPLDFVAGEIRATGTIGGPDGH